MKVSQPNTSSILLESFASLSPPHFSQCIMRSLFDIKDIDRKKSPVSVLVDVNVDFKKPWKENPLTLKLHYQDQKIFSPYIHTVNFAHSSECPAEYRLFSPTHPISIPSKPYVIPAMVLALTSFFPYHDTIVPHILLSRRCKTMRSYPMCWVLPGGHLEEGESWINGVIREVKEEVGLSINPNTLSLLSLWEGCYPTRLAYGSISHHHLVIFLHSQINYQNSDICKLTMQDDEVDMYSWVDINTIGPISLNVSQNFGDIYPNNAGTGIGEGHLFALQQWVKHYSIS